jgi:hypothetical protein
MGSLPWHGKFGERRQNKEKEANNDRVTCEKG